jgi:hypothetical protein
MVQQDLQEDIGRSFRGQAVQAVKDHLRRGRD